MTIDLNFTDEEKAEMVVLDPDLSEPVEIEEVEEPVPAMPDEWAAQLDEADWDERFEGVEITEDPEDGEPDGD